jgi:hypothetical protein
VTIIDSERQKQDSQDTLLKFVPKMILGLISATIVPVFALFIITLVAFGSYLIYSILFRQEDLGVPKLLDTIRAYFVVSFAASATLLLFVIICVALFGIPITLLGWRLGLIRLRTCVLTGFFLGSIPGGLFLYSAFSDGSSSANGVQYWINGGPTSAGLFQFTILVLVLGLLGALGGYSFWLIWRLLTRREELKQSHN